MASELKINSLSSSSKMEEDAKKIAMEGENIIASVTDDKVAEVVQQTQQQPQHQEEHHGMNRCSTIRDDLSKLNKDDNLINMDVVNSERLDISAKSVFNECEEEEMDSSDNETNVGKNVKKPNVIINETDDEEDDKKLSTTAMNENRDNEMAAKKLLEEMDNEHDEDDDYIENSQRNVVADCICSDTLMNESKMLQTLLASDVDADVNKPTRINDTAAKEVDDAIIADATATTTDYDEVDSCKCLRDSCNKTDGVDTSTTTTEAATDMEN